MSGAILNLKGRSIGAEIEHWVAGQHPGLLNRSDLWKAENAKGEKYRSEAVGEGGVIMPW